MINISTRAKSDLQEKLLERELGARRTPNSGATDKRKGDLQDQLSVFEAKTSMTAKQSYSVKKRDLEELEFNRRRDGKQFGFLVYDFGNTVFDETFVTMKLSDFIELYNTYKEEHGIE